MSRSLQSFLYIGTYKTSCVLDALSIGESHSSNMASGSFVFSVLLLCLTGPASCKVPASDNGGCTTLKSLLKGQASNSEPYVERMQMWLTDEAASCSVSAQCHGRWRGQERWLPTGDDRYNSVSKYKIRQQAFNNTEFTVDLKMLTISFLSNFANRKSGTVAEISEFLCIESPKLR